MLTTDQLNRLQNFGFTDQGAAIVDAIWFTPPPTISIGMVLICNPVGIWKAYISTIVQSAGEERDAQFVAAHGSKLPYAIAKAAFPTRDFDNLNYDLGKVQVRDGD
jgi:hypothetical protein